MGSEWRNILYRQYTIDYASEKLYQLELTMLSHQPGDKSSANRMSSRVREISSSLEAIIDAAQNIKKEKKKDTSDGTLSMIG
jgi:hypothetical protein